MPSTYVPRRDVDLRDWAAAFATHASAEPVRFGVTVGEAALIQGLVDAFVATLTAALERRTRTAGAVVAKDGARAAMVAALRYLAQRVRFDERVSEADKRVLGLAPAKTSRTRVARPATAPCVSVTVTAPNRHTVRFVDSATPTRGAKPAGVVGMQLFVAVADGQPGTVPTPSIREATYQAFVTRQLQSVDYPMDVRGRVAHYYARWQNTRGEVGPWSMVASVGIGG
jgi:hypothetical protein